MSTPADLDLLLQSADRPSIAALALAAGRVGQDDARSRFAQALLHRVEASRSVQLTPAEHDLIREAWKAEIAPRRAACATLATLPSGADPLLPSWRAELEQDLAQRAGAWLSLLRETLLPPARGHAEHEPEYLTWVGDLESALAERFPGAGHDPRAAQAYEEALDLARSKLPVTHPIRLGLVINYATCIYEILKEHKKAVELAKRAFDEGVGRLDQLEAAAQGQASAQLQLLWDMLQRWQAGEAG